MQRASKEGSTVVCATGVSLLHALILHDFTAFKVQNAVSIKTHVIPLGCPALMSGSTTILQSFWH